MTYRDDPDRQNLVDWIQEQWLECCGIEGPKGLLFLNFCSNGSSKSFPLYSLNKPLQLIFGLSLFLKIRFFRLGSKYLF